MWDNKQNEKVILDSSKILSDADLLVKDLTCMYYKLQKQSDMKGKYRKES